MLLGNTLCVAGLRYAQPYPPQIKPLCISRKGCHFNEPDSFVVYANEHLHQSIRGSPAPSGLH